LIRKTHGGGEGRREAEWKGMQLKNIRLIGRKKKKEKEQGVLPAYCTIIDKQTLIAFCALLSFCFWFEADSSSYVS